jgi:hypothetical protein
MHKLLRAGRIRTGAQGDGKEHLVHLAAVLSAPARLCREPFIKASAKADPCRFRMFQHIEPAHFDSIKRTADPGKASVIACSVASAVRIVADTARLQETHSPTGNLPTTSYFTGVIDQFTAFGCAIHAGNRCSRSCFRRPSLQ